MVFAARGERSGVKGRDLFTMLDAERIVSVPRRLSIAGEPEDVLVAEPNPNAVEKSRLILIPIAPSAAE